jgi:hypothetical protein
MGLVWKRHDFGWLSPDGQAFAERGAPMTCGGTAWLVWVRVDPSTLARSEGGLTTYLIANGNPVRTLAELADGASEDPETGWFAHVGDEGSLADAKQAAAYHLAQAEKK